MPDINQMMFDEDQDREESPILSKSTSFLTQPYSWARFEITKADFDELPLGKFDVKKIVEEEGVTEEEARKRKKTKVCLFFTTGHQLVINNDIRKFLTSVFGSETDNWSGKVVEVYHEPAVKFGDRVVGGVRVRMGGLGQQTHPELGSVPPNRQEPQPPQQSQQPQTSHPGAPSQQGPPPGHPAHPDYGPPPGSQAQQQGAHPQGAFTPPAGPANQQGALFNSQQQQPPKQYGWPSD